VHHPQYRILVTHQKQLTGQRRASDGTKPPECPTSSRRRLESTHSPRPILFLSVKWLCGPRRWLLRQGTGCPGIEILVAPVIALIGQPRTSQGHAPAMVADAGARQRGGQNGKRDEPCTRDSACFGRLGGHGGGAGCWSSRQGLTAATGMWYATRRLTIGCLERDMWQSRQKTTEALASSRTGRSNRRRPAKGCGSQPTLSARENAGTAHPDQARRSTVVPPHRATTKGP
jgi:hypothetical protein